MTSRLREGLRFGLSDLADHLLPWLALGLILASLAEALVPELEVGSFSPLLAVPAAALLALPLYMCATGSTPLLAILLHKGLSPGAALAFLVAGPSVNAETFSLARELHGRAGATSLGVATLAVAVSAGFAVDMLLMAGLGRVSTIEHVSRDGTLVQQLSLATLMVLGLASLLRSGARGWLGQLQARYGEHVHTQVASHDCDHDHGHAHAHAH